MYVLLPRPTVFVDDGKFPCARIYFPDYIISTCSRVSSFCCFLPYSLISYECLATSFLAYSLLYVAVPTLLRPLIIFVFSGCIPSFALHTVLLIVLEHPGIFFAAVICTFFSSCFTRFAFPSHMSPAHSSFGIIYIINPNTCFMYPSVSEDTLVVPSVPVILVVYLVPSANINPDIVSFPMLSP